MKNVPELLEDINLFIIKITSQKTNKFFIYEKDKIRNYKNLIITNKSDAVDEIINKLNKKFPNWYIEITNDNKEQTLSKGKKQLIEYISYDCDRINDIINDPSQNLFFKENNKSYFNLFQNTYYLNQDIKSGLVEKDWSLIKKIILNLVSNNVEYYDWVINWLAVLYQYPTYRFTTSMIFIGQKGSGKGMLSNVLRFLFGDCSYSANSTDLISNFNAQLFEGKVLLLANEILDQHNKYQFSNNLKEFITEKVISVEKKFCDRYQAKNFVKLILFSNSTQPIHIEEDDRRYAIFYSKNKISNILTYNELKKFFEDEDFFKNQVEGFAYYLQNQLIDVSKVVNEPIMTPAKKNIIEINLSDFRSIIDELIEDGNDFWVEDSKGLYYINYKKLYTDYILFFENKKLQKLYPKNKFGSKLRIEQYLVFSLKSINNIKGTWVRVPYRIIKKIYYNDLEKLQRIKEELNKERYVISDE